MRCLLLVESFDLSPSDQHILVRVIPSCFHFTKMCFCQLSLLSRCSSRYFTSSQGSCTLFLRTGGHVPFRVVNVKRNDLDQLAFIPHFLNQFWIASRLVCSSCEQLLDQCPWPVLQYRRKGSYDRFW
jgi:hypothetical protein